MGRLLAHLMNEARYFAEKNKMEDSSAVPGKLGASTTASGTQTTTMETERWHISNSMYKQDKGFPIIAPKDWK